MPEASIERGFHRARVDTYRPDLRPYPMDMSSLLTARGKLRGDLWTTYGFTWSTKNDPDHPVLVAQYALAHWNAYRAYQGDAHQEAFLADASWLLTHQSLLSADTGGWPVAYKRSAHDDPRYVLSALAQGSAISVLVRAYQATRNNAFLVAAQRAVRTFQMDILDGGVAAPIGDRGIFFEEFAVYPATHTLHSYLLALLGLYDYVAVTEDRAITALIERSLATFRLLVEEYDTGHWTYYDLGHRQLATRSHHALYISLLETLAAYTECEHYATLARRWRGYQQGIQYFRHVAPSHIVSYCAAFMKMLLRYATAYTITSPQRSTLEQICVPITAFPVAGGMRGVLAGVADVMKDQWQFTYVTHHKGEEAEELTIEVFGRRGFTSPWQFPTVWLYFLAGGFHLLKLLRRNTGVRVIVPQDGVYTAAFAVLIGKLLGLRVVCMDHGNIACLESAMLRKEREQRIVVYRWPLRVIAKCLLTCYWLSLRLLARVATSWGDHFLVAGDEVEKVYRERLGIHPSRMTRYVYVVDAERIVPFAPVSRAKIRARYGIPQDAVLITLINRLAPEKGLPIALEGIAQALAELPIAVRQCVKVLIAGDGPLRSQVERDIARHHLSDVCKLCGEATQADVAQLLGSSDIFLYSGTRGTNYSMAVLEAMAAGCAVVATTLPLSNARLLDEGRGVAIPPGDAHALGSALVRLCKDEGLRQRMGKQARTYITMHHNATVLKRTLLRVCGYTPPCHKESYVWNNRNF